MRAIEPITPTAASGPPTLGDAAVEIVPLISTVFVAGPPVVLVWAGTVLFALLLAGPFALIVTLVVVLAAAVALAMLAGAIMATPYLLVRHFGRRLAERRRVSRTARATFVTAATEGSS